MRDAHEVADERRTSRRRPTASSVVSSSPRSPGVTRSQTKRAGPRALRSTGRSTRASGRSAGRSACARATRACGAVLRRRAASGRATRSRRRATMTAPERERALLGDSRRAGRSSARRRSRAGRSVAPHSAGAEDVVGHEAPQRHAATSRPGTGATARTRPTKRPMKIALPPWRSKKRSTCSRRSSVIWTRGAVRDEEVAAEPAAEVEAREVAGDRARPDDRDQRRRRRSGPGRRRRRRASIAVSPGATRPTNAPVSRNASDADEQVGPAARGVSPMSMSSCSRFGSWTTPSP